METQPRPESGFTTPQIPKDEETRNLYERHNLPPTPTLGEIEPIAMTLLERDDSIIEAAQLILGRRVDAQELMLGNTGSLVPFLLLAPSPDRRFGILLLQKGIENDRETRDESASN